MIITSSKMTEQMLGAHAYLFQTSPMSVYEKAMLRNRYNDFFDEAPEADLESAFVEKLENGQ